VQDLDTWLFARLVACDQPGIPSLAEAIRSRKPAAKLSIAAAGALTASPHVAHHEAINIT
jgi:hypothetical protein